VTGGGLRAGREAPPARVLFRFPNWLGDLVMALPALEAARRLWPSARIDGQVHSRLAELLAGDPRLAELQPVPERGGASWRAVAAALRRERYDLALLCPPSLSSALVAFVGGIPRRVGRRGDTRDLLLTDPLPAGVRTRPQVEQYVDLVRYLGFAGAAPRLAYDPGEAARESAARWCVAKGPGESPFVVVAPGASYGVSKVWPVKRFAELLNLLHQGGGVRALLVGSPAERPLLAAVAAAASPGVALVFDGGGLRETAALLARARLVVSNDTGALHLGRAVGTPVLGLFTSTAPEWTGPAPGEGVALAAGVGCRPCFRRECPLPRGRYACLEAIGVGEAYEAARALLAAPAEARP
jgi:heptosyltransferase-2